jgi:pilin isopeptide linkage protein
VLYSSQQPVMAFINTYAVEGEVPVTITGTKNLLGGKKLADNMFTFQLFKGTQAAGTPVAQVQNKADGSISFNLSFEAPGKYTYTVKELAPAEQEAEGIRYEDRVYYVDIEILDDGKGGMTAKAPVYRLVSDAVAVMEFTNVYTPEDITVALDITKTVKVNSGEGVSPAGFKFQLADKNGVLSTVESDSNGKARFQVIFQAEDVGKTFDFAITEVDTKVTGVTYSKVKHEVQITIAQNAAGELVPQLKLGGEAVDALAVSFVNTFDAAETPETGDSFNGGMLIMMMAASAFGLVTLLLGKKKEFEC